MTGSRVGAFFDGAHITLNVFSEVNCVPEAWEDARLAGFDTPVQPRANVVRSDQTFLHGILATGTPARAYGFPVRSIERLGSFRP
jgi:hypothetical protein